MATLLNKIKYLHPDVKCSVWNTSNLSEYMGENPPILLYDCLIDWSTLNPYPCPSQEEIESLDDSIVDVEIFKREEAVRKELRDERAKEDLSILSGFRQEKKLSPDKTFTEYLDELESLGGTL